MADAGSTPVIPKGGKNVEVQSPVSRCISQGRDDLDF